MVRRTRRRRTTIDRRRAESLLYPIAAFLHAGGLTAAESLAIFSSALDGVLKGRKGRQMEHIGHPTLYADIVAAWTRGKHFVDTTGRPRALRFSGKTGFSALVRRASPKTNPRTALSVLKRYGNVRELKDGRLELTRPFFFTSSWKTMAFEPMAYFLSDASATLSRILRRQRRSRSPELFWRKVESICMSEAVAKKFTIFARERCLLFLEELDDWLQAHSSPGTSQSSKGRRVGMGLFSIYSDLEPQIPIR
jgi:hypothetical protein